MGSLQVSHRRDPKMPDLRIVGVDDLIGISNAVQFHLMNHVRLTRADPYIADEDIGYRNVVGGINMHGVRPAGFHRRQLNEPFPGPVAIGFIIFSIECNLDLFSGRCPSPDMDLNISLQYHAVSYKSWQTHLSGN